MLTLKIIRETVEKVSGVKDLSSRTKTLYLTQCRYKYFKLCKIFKKELKNPTLAKIGKEVDRDHATVLHGLKTFDNLYKNNQLVCVDVYKDCLDIVSKYIMNPEELEDVKDIENINKHYRVRQIRLEQKYRSVINKLSYKLRMYRGNEIVDKIVKLNEEDYKDLEVKLDAFFKVKNAKKS